MSVLYLPQYLLDGWSVCETLRRFGFSQEEMTIGFGPLTGVGDDVLHICLNTQGVEFIAAAAVVPGQKKESVLAEWDSIWKLIIDATDEDLSLALAKSLMGDYRRVVMLAAELTARGIILPALPEAEQSSLALTAGRAIVFSSPGGSA
jgi:hypothetical protein